MAGRNRRAALAAETVGIAQGGTYVAPSGARVDITAAIREAVDNTVLIGPSNALLRWAGAVLAQRSFKTAFEVRNESTFAAARRLVQQFGPDRVAALNFASAKNPGGGFLNGSQAQEESLTRASALYPCLLSQSAYYDANRAERSLLYTDHMIVSPRVPVFRDDEDELIDEPWAVTIITAPAPNAGALATNDPDALPEVEPTFRRRIERVLAAAAMHDQTALVLGAWGCGVFKNDPEMVARLFAEFLLPGGSFAQAFEQVVFAVLDREGQTFAAFEQQFSKPRMTGDE